jgi:light-regulated signal transduction histidine kinase (bacteriophytochrome)
MIGHLFKIVAFYLIYKAIVQTGIVKPYNLVFRELKQSEAALRAVIADLAREIEVRRQAQAKVDGLNEALQKHAVELEMANNELEAFAYSVSHDLRAPLRSIEGFSRLVLDDYEGQVPPGARQFLQLIHDNAKETDTLVAGLLALSRTSSQALRKQTVIPGEIIRQVIGELADAQAGRCVEFSVGEMPDCQADPLLLKQVWVNLLSNALKFTRKRPVARIEVGCGQFDGESAFFIRDNGAGFDMHQAEKLFGVFQRFHKQEDYEGTGVGLAIVARIIRRHGGRIWAHAELDQGATFYFTL